MSKLEQYLDQVCHGIAGPRSLRQHIRRELEEHIRDSAAQYRAGGLSEEESLAKALDDFGGPEQVRAELEAAHGHRVMAVVVDKALEWKEKTMKAKWLWSTWAHVMLLLTIAAEVTFIYGCIVLIVPKFREYAREGWIDVAGTNEIGPMNQWALSVIHGVTTAALNGWWVLLVAVLVWSLFEWRGKSEHKSFMRLGALGTVALSLGAVAFMTAAALILPLTIAADPVLRTDVALQLKAQHASDLTLSMKSLDEAIAANDWNGIWRQVDRVERDIDFQYATGAPLMADSQQIQRVRKEYQDTKALLRKAHHALQLHDNDTLVKVLGELQKTYAQWSVPATKPRD